jgi:UDP-glucose 4-epimerase
MTHRPSIPPGTNCLVLGGGGFIGTHLCRDLLQRGAVVKGFGRRQAFPGALRGVKWTLGEFTDRAALARAVDGQEIVYLMLGGSMPEGSNNDPVADLMSSTVATLHLLELCLASGVRKLIFVSSGGTVYGVPQRTPIPESAPTDPISAYGISKLATEKYLHLFWYLYGLEYAILRVANPFGPYQMPGRGQGVVAALLHRVLQDQPVEIWGDGRVVRDFLYVGDVVEALIAVSSYVGEQRVFNVGCGVGRSILAVIEDIGKTLGRPSVRKLHKPGRATDVPVNVLDITRIRQELGWEPTTAWHDALRMTAEWIAQNL